MAKLNCILDLDLNMKNKQKGFTLIELVITMLVLVIVFGMLAGLVGFATRFYSDESSQVNRQETLRLLAVTFEKDVRRLVEHEAYFTSSESGGVKTFELGEPASAGLITYTFNSTEGRVYRTKSGTTTTVATDILNVSVTKDASISTHPFLHFTVQGRPDGRGTVNEVDIKVYLRILQGG